MYIPYKFGLAINDIFLLWVALILPVIVSFISPYRDKREEARARSNGFVEIFLDCPLEACEARDVKGMYKKALAGEIKNFTGVDDPYEEPPSPEIIADTETETVDESVEKVLKYLEKNGYL